MHFVQHGLSGATMGSVQNSALAGPAVAGRTAAPGIMKALVF